MIVQAVTEFRKNGTIPPGPETVHIDLVNRCNCQCITCWSFSPHLPRNSEKEPAAILPLSRFTPLITELQQTGVYKIILSGSGEPFIHPDIYSMIGLTKEAGMHVTVITNGTLIDKKRLLLTPPDKLLLNICAATPEIYVATHPGQSQKNFTRLIKMARQINNTCCITLVMVIHNLNYRQLPQMVNLAASFPNARLSFKPASLTEHTSRYTLNREMIMELTDTLIPEAEKLADTQDVAHNLDIFRVQMEKSITGQSLESIGCYAGLFYSRIHHDGSVTYCCAPIKTGSINESSFIEIWNSPEYTNIRKRMEKRQFFPACSDCGKFNLNYMVNALLGEQC